MKKTILAIVLCAAMLISSIGLAERPESQQGEDVIAAPDVLNYAKGEALDFIKGFMKDSSHGFIGTAFASAEEVDSAQVTRISLCRPLGEDPSDAPADGEAQKNTYWYCVVSGSSGPAASFLVMRDGNGNLSHMNADICRNYAQAEAVMQKLANEAGIMYEPVIFMELDTILLALKVNDEYRLIPVLPSGYKFDEAYNRVTSFEQLPTKADALAASAERSEWAAAHPDQDGNLVLQLSPKLNAGGARIAWLIGGAAAGAAVIAAAVILLAKKRKNR